MVRTGSDITYNPTTNKFYLTPTSKTSSGTNRNVIYVLNGSDFSKESEIQIGTDTTVNIYGIAYDSVNNQYWIAMLENASEKLVKLNSSFQIVTKYAMEEYGVSSFGNVFQNIECYDGKVFVSYSEKVFVFDSTRTYLSNFSTMMITTLSPISTSDWFELETTYLVE